MDGQPFRVLGLGFVGRYGVYDVSTKGLSVRV